MKMARIMVVEDEGIVARDIQNRLKGLGYAVPAIASSGLEAIEKAAETQPDLVLMDIRLRGDMDGVKAAEQIGARFSIPIIYLTAYADEETLERAKQTEPFGYILKPFEDRELHTAIQIGLYKHNMERKLRESEQWLATTLSSIGDGVIASDGKGRITFVNPVAEAMTGWRREQALHQDLTKVFNIVNGETRAPAENPVMKALREGVVVDLTDHILIANGGTERAIGDSAAPIRDEKGNITGAVLVFKDITQRRQAEQERTHLLADTQRHLKRITALREITLAMTSTLELRAVLDVLLEKIDLLLPYPIATIRLLNRETGQLEPVACRNLNEEDWKKYVEKSQGGFSKAVFESGAPMMITNVQTDPRRRDDRFFDRQGVVSYLGVPMVAKGEILGVLAFSTREEHRFSNEEVEFLTTLAGQAAIAVHNSWLYEQVQRRTHELAALYDITATVNQSLEMEPVLQEVIKKITEIFHFDATRIYLFNTQMDELHLRASFENVPDSFKAPTVVPRGQGINGRVGETGEPMIFEDAQSDPRYKELSHSKATTEAGFRFFAAFPVKVKEKSVGTMICIGRMPRSLTTDEVQLITSMAEEIGVSVENTRLFEETKAKGKELSALYGITSTTTQSLDLSKVLEEGINKIMESFNFDEIGVFLLQNQPDEMHLKASSVKEKGPWHRPKFFRLGEGLASRVARSGEPLIFDDIQTDARYQKLARTKTTQKAGYRSLAVIPITSREKTIGTIDCVSRSPQHLTRDEVQLLKSMADHFGIAVVNANLFEEVRKKSQELEALVKINSDVAALLDRETLLPRIAEEARRILKVDVASFRLIEEGTIALAGYAGKGDLRGLRPRLHLDESVTGRIIRKARPVAIRHLQEEPATAIIEEHRKIFRKSDYHSFLGVPLLLGGQVIGTINFYSKEERNFRPEEISLISGFADQAAIAVENARLYAQTKDQATQLEKDIIERKRAEEALRHSEARTRSIVESAVDGIITFNEQGVVESLNHAAEKIFGYAADEVIGQNVKALMPHPFHSQHDSYLRNYLSTGEAKIIGSRREVVGLRKDGTTFPMDLAVGDLQLGDRRMFTGIVRDISARKHAEEQLQVAQKQILAQQEQTTERVEVELSRVQTKLIRQTRLAAIGQVSASIAHELRNPLGAIRNAAYLLKRCLNATDPKGSEYLGIVEEEVYNADRIIGNLMEMSRGKEPNKQVVELAALVREVYKTLRVRSTIQFSCAFVPEAFVVWCDWGQMWQVFINLFTNALQAMENSGTLKVEGFRSPTADVITVKDSGPGITNEAQERVFEPLYTTKAKGTGLGLTICRQIIAAHGGSIEVVENSHRGTAICFQLPLRLAT